MRIRINPLDTLFFRDGKPFARGEETWADGVFPPYPSVLYGAMRTWFIANHPILAHSQEAIQLSEKIQVNAIYYKTTGGLHLPLPCDMVEVKSELNYVEQNRQQQEKTYPVKKLRLSTAAQAFSSYPLPEILTSGENEVVEQPDGGFIQADHFLQYLEGTLQDVKIRKLKDLAVPEPKIGIGRNDDTRTVEEGQLYRVGMRRANDFQIIADIDFPENQSEAMHRLFRFGAEGKIASFDILQKSIDALDVSGVTLKDYKAFKLYLATPAIFDKGWCPDLSKEEIGIKAELVAAALGKTVHIGGFDMVKWEPKPMLKAVPAGSVYYYRTLEDPETILSKLQGKSVSDHMARQGFGIAYIGNF